MKGQDDCAMLDIISKAIDAKYTEIESLIGKKRELTEKLTIEQKTVNELFNSTNKEKIKTIQDKYALQRKEIYRKQKYYQDEEMATLQKQSIHTNDDSDSIMSLEENDVYIKKKEVLDRELEVQIARCNSQYEMNLKKLQNQFLEKDEKREARLAKKKEAEEKKNERYLAQIKGHLESYQHQLDVIEKKEVDDVKVLITPPKTKAMIKFEEEIAMIDSHCERRKKDIEKLEEQHNNEQREMNARIRYREEQALRKKEKDRILQIEEDRIRLEESRLKYDERERELQLYKEKIQREEGRDYDRERKEFLASSPPLYMTITKEGEKLLQITSKTNNDAKILKQQLTVQYPTLEIITAITAKDGKVLFTIEDKKGNVLLAEWYDSEKEFKKKYKSIDVLEYSEIYDDELEKCKA